MSNDGDKPQEQVIGTDEAIIAYIRNGDARRMHKCGDGCYELPWLGQPIPKGHTIYGELYAMPAATSSFFDDGTNDFQKWLIEESLPAFKEQIEIAGWSNARIGRASMLRDPYSAKPYVLFYVSAKAFDGTPPVPFA